MCNKKSKCNITIDLVERIINAYYQTKMQMNEEHIDYLSHHDFCERVLKTFKHTDKMNK